MPIEVCYTFLTLHLCPLILPACPPILPGLLHEILHVAKIVGNLPFFLTKDHHRPGPD